MAVIQQIVVESRRYSGWIDPRYPIGYWQAALSVTGDATGGDLAIDLVFQGAEPPFLNSQLYSVERLSVSSSEATSRAAMVLAVNMGGPANQGFLHRYMFTLQGTNFATRSAGRAEQFGGLVPWFLGSQRTAGITASLSIGLGNINGVTYEFEAEGYRWSPRSVLVDGGPQRPPTGLYQR